MQTLLTWHASISDPATVGVVLVLFAVTTQWLLQHPKHYYPLVILTVALPKLATIGYRNEVITQVGYIDSSDPGFSLLEIVLVAGIAAAILGKWWRNPVSRPCGQVTRAMLLWGGSIVASVCVGLLLWYPTYRAANALYVARYILTLCAFGVATVVPQRPRSRYDFRAFLSTLWLVGNIVVLLGLIYHLNFGTTGGVGTAGKILYGREDSLVFRNVMWFFDSGTDMAFFTVLVVLLNLTCLVCWPGLLKKAVSAIGIILCMLCLALYGQRAGTLVLLVALWRFYADCSKNRLRPQAGLNALPAIIVFMGMALCAWFLFPLVVPDSVVGKFEGSLGVGVDAGSFAAANGVPSEICAILDRLPLGDFTFRAAFALSSLFFFFQHPLGVGFWGELQVVGWFAHHEVVKVLVEQGLFGMFAFCLLIWRLRLLLRRPAPGSPRDEREMVVVLRALATGLFTALIMANTVVLAIKFAVLFWTMLGFAAANDTRILRPIGQGGRPARAVRVSVPVSSSTNDLAPGPLP